MLDYQKQNLIDSSETNEIASFESVVDNHVCYILMVEHFSDYGILYEVKAIVDGKETESEKFMLIRNAIAFMKEVIKRCFSNVELMSNIKYGTDKVIQ